MGRLGGSFFTGRSERLNYLTDLIVRLGGGMSILSFPKDLGMYPRHTLHTLSDELHHKVIQSIGQLAIRTVFSAIFPENLDPAHN